VRGQSEGYFYGTAGRRWFGMVDKPGRRKKQSLLPWKKVAAVAVAAVVVVAVGWEAYWNFVYVPPDLYAQINTSDGSFEVVLYPSCAPQTVSNFVSLANSGFYKDLVWHRIIPGFVMQTGDPHSRGGNNNTRTTWGQGFSNTTGLTSSDLKGDHNVPLEVSRCPNLGTYQGYLAIARAGNLTAGLDTGNTQFFVNLSNGTSNLQISGHYTVFGKVISGWSVVQSVAKSPLCQSPTCPSNWPSGEPLHPVFVTDIVILGTSASTSTNGTQTG